MKIKKLALCAFAVFSLMFCFNVTPVDAAEAVYPQTYDGNIQIQPRADIIDWRYKVVDRKLYRRQYNYTKQKWIGEWELL